MKNIHIHKQKVFRETEDVLFYDITIKESNASDLVIHDSAAVSPPDDDLGNKQFYVHYHQIDNNRVVHGSRTFELINFDWDKPYQIIKLTRNSGALRIPKGTFHRSISSDIGSIVINQSERDDLFQTKKEFQPVSVIENEKLAYILKNIKPVIVRI
ncbi:MAG: hypothetical protein VYE09_02195 [Pseudomonadota bacterium]|nr:hypothetical protein [Pseudomonadota bacterium]